MSEAFARAKVVDNDFSPAPEIYHVEQDVIYPANIAGTSSRKLCDL